jgi:hypothetical protein
MHGLAELMDNAAAFSAHGSEVHVFVEEEDAGIVVTVDDSGLGMRRRERDRAEELVSQSLDLATLPGTRLGLAVVGRVASRYGLSVNFRPSSRGGTGVVVLLPRRLISYTREDLGAIPARPATPSWSPARTASAAAAVPPPLQAQEAARTRQIPAPPPVETSPSVSASPVTRFRETEFGDTGSSETRPGGTTPGSTMPGGTVTDDDLGDLPVRPRGRTLAQTMRPAPGAPAPGASAGQDAPAPRPARSAGARFAAFREAGSRGRGGATSAPPASREPGPGSEEDGSKGSA